MSVIAPVSIAKQLVYSLLAQHDPLVALVGAYEGGPSIFPSVAPVAEQGVHLTYSHSAWATTDTQPGKPVMWVASFDVSAWSPGWDDSPLGAVEAEMLTALVGAEREGRTLAFNVTVGEAAQQGHLTIKALAPLPTNGEYEGAGVWQRVSHGFRVALQ